MHSESPPRSILLGRLRLIIIEAISLGRPRSCQHRRVAQQPLNKATGRQSALLLLRQPRRGHLPRLEEARAASLLRRLPGRFLRTCVSRRRRVLGLELQASEVHVRERVVQHSRNVVRVERVRPRRRYLPGDRSIRVYPTYTVRVLRAVSSCGEMMVTGTTTPESTCCSHQLHQGTAGLWLVRGGTALCSYTIQPRSCSLLRYYHLISLRLEAFFRVEHRCSRDSRDNLLPSRHISRQAQNTHCNGRLPKHKHIYRALVRRASVPGGELRPRSAWWRRRAPSRAARSAGRSGSPRRGAPAAGRGSSSHPRRGQPPRALPSQADTQAAADTGGDPYYSPPRLMRSLSLLRPRARGPASMTNEFWREVPGQRCRCHRSCLR